MLVRSLQVAIREIVPRTRPGFVSKTGTSDMNVVGPGDRTLEHTPHKHLDLDEYWRAVLVLGQTLRKLGQNL